MEVLRGYNATKQFYVNENEWGSVKKMIFFPVAPRKSLFDIIVMACIVWSCLEVPYRMAFIDGIDRSQADQIIQYVFMLDLILNFNTAFLHHERWIIHRPSIARNYLRGWFWIDAPASLPLAELYALVVPPTPVGSASTPSEVLLLRIFRLARLLRLLKVLKLGEFLRTIEFSTGMSLSGLQAVNIVLFGFYLAHLLACGFYLLSVVSSASYSDSWVGSYGFESGDVKAGPFERYVVSLIWSVATMSGTSAEIGPENHMERLFVLVSFAITAIFYAVLIAVVTQQYSAYINSPYNLRMAEVTAFCRFHQVPRGLREKTSAFFEVLFHETPASLESDIINKLAPALQDQMWNHLLSTTVQQIGLFASLEKRSPGGGGKLGRMFDDQRAFQRGIYQALKFHNYSAGDVVLDSTMAHEELFFLRKGEIFACDHGRHLFSLAQIGSFCGERCLLEESTPELLEFEARTRCDMFAISKSDFIQLVAEHLIPAKRVQLAKDLLAEIVYKSEQHISSLRVIAVEAGAERGRDMQRISELTAALELLSEQKPEEALALITEGC